MGNPLLPHLQALPDPSFWARKRITNLKHITKDSKLRTLRGLRALYSIPNSWEFRYSVDRLLISSTMGKPLSSLYLYLTVAHDIKPTQSLDKSKTDIQTLDDEGWEDCLHFYPLDDSTKRQVHTNSNLFTGPTTPPQRLGRIYPHRDPLCPRCRQEVGSF